MFKGKVIIVTGGGSGFGKAIAESYAEAGAKVVIADISEESGNETIDLLNQKGGESIFVKTDVGKAEDCKNLVEKTVEKFGRLDIAINNAGIGGEPYPIGEFPIEWWDRMIQVNLSGIFYCMRYEIPEMLKNGGGVIVNMSSVLGLVGFVGAAPYVASKHAIIGITKNVALEYGIKNIRANAVCPGHVQTPINEILMKNTDSTDSILKKYPMQRLGKIDEVRDLVLWLSSDRASFCNGSYYVVDGGYSAK